jgi:hypothetical protein
MMRRVLLIIIYIDHLVVTYETKYVIDMATTKAKPRCPRRSALTPCRTALQKEYMLAGR